MTVGRGGLPDRDFQNPQYRSENERRLLLGEDSVLRERYVGCRERVPRKSGEDVDEVDVERSRPIYERPQMEEGRQILLWQQVFPILRGRICWEEQIC